MQNERQLRGAKEDIREIDNKPMRGAVGNDGALRPAAIRVEKRIPSVLLANHSPLVVKQVIRIKEECEEY